MRTNFTAEQLSEPDMAASEGVLRTCVHCGLCTATCPTYLLLGDELDSPRGRIHQIQNMLEAGGAPTAETVKHVDRCLSCLSCMTTCPSGVNYMRLVDHARTYIEENYRRPAPERWLRSLLSAVLTRPRLFRAAIRAGALMAWAAPLAPGRLKAIAQIAPRRLPQREPEDGADVFPAVGARRMRVALLGGCVQPGLAPQINRAAVRLLNRHGVEVVITADADCCGALPHHLGKAERARALAARQISAWMREIEGEGLDAIVTTTSGCGTTLKDYGFMFRADPAWAAKAEAVSGLALDISELVARIGLQPPVQPSGLAVAYHGACSLQHGQAVRDAPKKLLTAAGFRVLEPVEAHICCGSAGTYSLLQPKIAGQLGRRKAEALDATGGDVIATGNIGCLEQIANRTSLPILHVIELLDWATGGPRPLSIPMQTAAD